MVFLEGPSEVCHTHSGNREFPGLLVQGEPKRFQLVKPAPHY